MLTRRDRDVVSSLVCIGVGMLFCVGSVKFGDIRAGFPSAGFFPFVAGVILFLLSLIQLVGVFITGKAREGKGEEFFQQKDSLKRLVITLVILFFYGGALVYVGFLITTFLFMVLLLRCLKPQKWKPVLLTAFLTSLSSYTLFEILLKVQLPRGILGIGHT